MPHLSVRMPQACCILCLKHASRVRTARRSGIIRGLKIMFERRELHLLPLVYRANLFAD